MGPTCRLQHYSLPATVSSSIGAILTGAVITFCFFIHLSFNIKKGLCIFTQSSHCRKTPLLFKTQLYMHEYFELKTEIQIIQLSINLKLWITLGNLQWGEDLVRTGKQMIDLTEKSSVESNQPMFSVSLAWFLCFILDVGSFLTHFLVKLLLLDDELLPLKETQTYIQMWLKLSSLAMDILTI